MPQTSVDTSAVLIARYNPYRRSLVFHNPSANIIFVTRGSPGGVTINNAGIRIPAGATRFFDWFHDGQEAISDQWSAISDTGTNTLVWEEFSSKGIPTLKFEAKSDSEAQ